MKKLLAVVLLLALPSLASAQAFRVGSGAQLVPRLTAPTKITTNGVVWLSSSTNALQYTNPAGTTIALGAGGGGGVTWPLTNGTATNTYTSAVVDGATVVGHAFDTTNAFATTGGKLTSFRSATAEKAYVTYNGAFVSTLSNSAIAVGGVTEGFGWTGGAAYFYAGGTARWTYNATALSPQSVGGLTLGTATSYWSTVFSNNLTLISNAATPSAAGQIVWDGTNFKYTTNGTTWTNFATGGSVSFPLVDSAALALATTVTPHLTMENTTAATVGATQQDSPALLLAGRAWNGSASIEDGWAIKAAERSLGGTYSSISFSRNTSGGAFSEIMRIGGLPGESVITGAQGFNSGAISLNNNNIWFYSTFVDITATLPQIILNSTAFYPYAAFSTDIGMSANPFGTTWSRRYAGVEQTIAAATSITLDPAAGETMRITLGATGITTINGAAGYPGEVIRVEVIQDAGGSRTIGGWSTAANGFKFSTTLAYAATPTGSKRDVLTFAWDSVAAMWIEVARVMNI